MTKLAIRPPAPRTGAGLTQHWEWDTERSTFLQDISTSYYWQGGSRVTPPLPAAWLGSLQNVSRDLLHPHEDLLEAVVAQQEGDGLSITALLKDDAHNPGLGMALARLEVKLTRTLADRFDDVVVRLIPARGLMPEERQTLKREGIKIL